MASDGRLLFDTAIDQKGFKEGVKNLEGSAKKGAGAVAGVFGKGLSGLGAIAGKAMQAVKTSFTIGLGAVTAFAGYSLKVGSDFSAGMSEVSAISGTTGADLEALTEKAKHMGATTQFSATESAEALKYMALAGWDTEQMMGGLGGVMALASASGEDLALVSDIVTDSMTAFGMEASESGHFADVLASASANANTSVSQLGEAFKYVAPVAGSLGYSVEDASVAIGLMGNAGIKAGQAGTTLRGALTRMIKPSKEAQAEMDKLGLSLVDSDGNMKPLNETIGDLRESFGELSEAEKAQTATNLFGQQSMSGMLAIINASEEDFNGLTESINGATGSAEEMARVMNDNLKGDITLFKSALEGIGIAFYEHMDGPAREVVQNFTGYLDSLNEAIVGPNEALNEFIETTGMTAEETGVVVEDSRSMIERIGATVGDILSDIILNIAEAVPQAVEGAKALIGGLFDGLTENSEVIGQAFSEILTGAIEIIVEYGGRFLELGVEIITSMVTGLAESAPQLVSQIQEAILSLLDTIIENLPEFIKSGMNVIENILEGIWDMLPDLIDSAGEIIDMLLEALIDNLPYIIDAGLRIIISLAEGILENIDKIIDATFEVVDILIDTVIDNLDLIIDVAFKIILAVVDGLLNNLDKIIDATFRILDALTDVFLDNLDLIIDTTIRIIITIANALIDNIDRVIEATFKIISGIVTAIIEKLPDILGAGVELLASFITGFFDGVGELLLNIGGLALDIIGALLTGLLGIFGVGEETVTELWNGITGMAGWVLEKVGGLAGDILGAITGGIGGVFDIGKNLVSGLWNGISGSANWIKDKVGGFASGVINKAKGVFGIKSPSTVFDEEIGEMLPAGMDRGVKDGTPKLLRSIDGQLDKVTDRFKEGLVGNQALKVHAESSVRHINEYDFVVDDQGKKLAMTSEMNVYSILDGRQVGKGTAKYVSQEQSLALKRRG